MNDKSRTGLWKTGLWVLAVVFSVAFAVSHAAAVTTHNTNTQKNQKSSSEWSKKAEENFFLAPGMGQKLMTKQEWEMHWKKMQNMKPDERTAYRDQWHKKFMQEARQRGMDIPSVPPEHGKQGHSQSAALMLANAAGAGGATGSMGMNSGRSGMNSGSSMETESNRNDSGFTGGTSQNQDQTGSRFGSGTANEGFNSGSQFNNRGMSDRQLVTFQKNKGKEQSDQDRSRGNSNSDMDRDRGYSGSDRDMDRGFQTDRNYHTDHDFGMMAPNTDFNHTGRSEFSLVCGGGSGKDMGRSGSGQSSLVWYHGDRDRHNRDMIVFVDEEHEKSWEGHERSRLHDEDRGYEFDRDRGAWGGDWDADRSNRFYHPYENRSDRDLDVGIGIHGDLR